MEGILVDAHGVVKVLDFGLAKLTEQTPPARRARLRNECRCGGV
jgi:hypothetical protein